MPQTNPCTLIPVKLAECETDIDQFFASARFKELSAADHELLSTISDDGQVKGTCNICNTDRVFDVDQSMTANLAQLNLRENFLCRGCNLHNRHRTLLISIMAYLDTSPGKTVWLAEHGNPFVDFLLSRYQNQHNFITSTFDVDSNIRYENIESLSFADASLDLIVTSDVMEHVNFPDRAWQECFRVLKPGGRNIFVVPIARYGLSTRTRCRKLPDGTIEHYGPPVYHDGMHLVYTDFGFDILETNKQLGYQKTTVEYYWSRQHLIVGCHPYHCVFNFIK